MHAIALAVYKIVPKSWIEYMKKIICRDKSCLQRGEDMDEQLLNHLEDSVDFERTHLLHHKVPRYNGPVDDYTMSS